MAEEFEVTFRVDSKDPEAVFRNISAIRSLGPYTLVPRDGLVFHDQYFDTPDSDLRSKKYALRLRTQGGEMLLCLKGKERVNAWGGISRLEIEGPWSERLLEQIGLEAGVLHSDTVSFNANDPVETLEGLSLFVIQSRQTSRTLSDIHLETGKDSISLGELALDKVSYKIQGERFVHYELEIEAKGDIREHDLKGFVSCLKEHCPGVLKRWDCNKLITGHALEALITEGSLCPDERQDDLIPGPWYDSIRTWIESGSKIDPKK